MTPNPSPPNTSTRLIYIGGYGRSGSTLLARLLGQDASTFCAGELVNLPMLDTTSEVHCSCGERAAECKVWGPVLTSLAGRDDAYRASLRRLDTATGGALAAVTWFDQRSMDAYGQYWHGAFSVLQAQLGDGPPQSIVDSSKTTLGRAARAFMLASRAGVEVKLIHLVRDGRGCLWSNLRGEDTGLLSSSRLKRRRGFPLLRTGLHWVVANLAAHWFRILHGRAHYLRLRYEDLVAGPQNAWADLSAFLGLPDGHLPAMTGPEAGAREEHMLAGNRMRNAPIKRVVDDNEWRTRLNRRQCVLFWLLTWPLMRLYGYRF